MFGSRVEARLNEFKFLWAVKPLGEGWSTRDTIKVGGNIPGDVLKKSMNPNTKWWAYAEKPDEDHISWKVVEVPFRHPSFADAIRDVARYWNVKYLVSCDSQVHSNHPAYTVWRVPENA